MSSFQTGEQVYVFDAKEVRILRGTVVAPSYGVSVLVNGQVDDVRYPSSVVGLSAKEAVQPTLDDARKVIARHQSHWQRIRVNPDPGTIVMKDYLLAEIERLSTLIRKIESLLDNAPNVASDDDAHELTESTPPGGTWKYGDQGFYLHIEESNVPGGLEYAVVPAKVLADYSPGYRGMMVQIPYGNGRTEKQISTESFGVTREDLVRPELEKERALLATDIRSSSYEEAGWSAETREAFRLHKESEVAKHTARIRALEKLLGDSPDVTSDDDSHELTESTAGLSPGDRVFVVDGVGIYTRPKVIIHPGRFVRPTSDAWSCIVTVDGSPSEFSTGWAYPTYALAYDQALKTCEANAASPHARPGALEQLEQVRTLAPQSPDVVSDDDSHELTETNLNRHSLRHTSAKAGAKIYRYFKGIDGWTWKVLTLLSDFTPGVTPHVVQAADENGHPFGVSSFEYATSEEKALELRLENEYDPPDAEKHVREKLAALRSGADIVSDDDSHELTESTGKPEFYLKPMVEGEPLTVLEVDPNARRYRDVELFPTREAAVKRAVEVGESNVEWAKRESPDALEHFEEYLRQARALLQPSPDTVSDDDSHELTESKGNGKAGRDLLAAAYLGDVTKVTDALAAGAKVDVRNPRGRTPLAVAARQGHGAVVKMLLDAGADPTVRDSIDKKPSDGCSGLLRQMLLEAEAKVAAPAPAHGVSERLHRALRGSSLSQVRDLVAEGVDLNVPVGGYSSALEYISVNWGDTNLGTAPRRRILELLLGRGLNPRFPTAKALDSILAWNLWMKPILQKFLTPDANTVSDDDEYGLTESVEDPAFEVGQHVYRIALDPETNEFHVLAALVTNVKTPGQDLVTHNVDAAGLWWSDTLPQAFEDAVYPERGPLRDLTPEYLEKFERLKAQVLAGSGLNESTEASPYHVGQQVYYVGYSQQARGFEVNTATVAKVERRVTSFGKPYWALTTSDGDFAPSHTWMPTLQQAFDYVEDPLGPYATITPESRDQLEKLKARTLFGVDSPADDDEHALTESMSLPEGTYVAVDGDGIGNKAATPLLRDDVDTASEVSDDIKAGQALIKRWVLALGGVVFVDGGDNTFFELASTSGEVVSARLQDLRKQYRRKTGFTLSAGYGATPSHAAQALVVAKATGKDKVVGWTPEVDAQYADAMAKASDALKLAQESGLTESALCYARGVWYLDENLKRFETQDSIRAEITGELSRKRRFLREIQSTRGADADLSGHSLTLEVASLTKLLHELDHPVDVHTPSDDDEHALTESTEAPVDWEAVTEGYLRYAIDHAEEHLDDMRTEDGKPPLVASYQMVARGTQEILSRQIEKSTEAFHSDLGMAAIQVGDERVGGLLLHAASGTGIRFVDESDITLELAERLDVALRAIPPRDRPASDVYWGDDDRLYLSGAEPARADGHTESDDDSHELTESASPVKVGDMVYVVRKSRGYTILHGRVTRILGGECNVDSGTEWPIVNTVPLSAVQPTPRAAVAVSLALEEEQLLRVLRQRDDSVADFYRKNIADLKALIPPDAGETSDDESHELTEASNRIVNGSKWYRAEVSPDMKSVTLLHGIAHVQLWGTDIHWDTGARVGVLAWELDPKQFYKVHSRDQTLLAYPSMEEALKARVAQYPAQFGPKYRTIRTRLLNALHALTHNPDQESDDDAYNLTEATDTPTP